MVDAGMGFLPSLEILASQQESDSAWETAKVSIVKQVESGRSLSAALSTHPEFFSRSQLVAIRGGERSGSVGKVLLLLEQKLLDEQKTKGRLKKAFTYPVFLIVLSLLGTFLLFKYVLPGILAGTQTGQSDFLPTKMLVLAIGFVNSWFGLMTIAFVVVFLISVLRREEVRRMLYLLLLDAPVAGSLLRNAACLDFATNLKLLVGSGTPIARAVEFSLSGSDSPAFRKVAPKITQRIMHGDTINDAFLAYRPLFANVLLDMIGLIDETSEYDTSLGAAIDYLRFDVEQRVEQFLTIIEPVVLIMVSALIAFVAIAVVVPIVQLSATL